MRRKYEYFVNGNKLCRKDFIHQLEMCCQKVIRTDMVGCIGIDLCDLDKKKFNSEMYAINQGIIVMFPEHNKTFRRKEVK